MLPSPSIDDPTTISLSTAALAFLRRHRGAIGAAVISAALVFGAAACGDDESTAVLSEAGERGRAIANSNGCASCHGSNGQGGAGPTWDGLAGSEVELDDGSVVVADDEYLRRAIIDPSAERNADYTLQMPENQLTDSEVDDVIAYINDLSPGAAGDGGAEGDSAGAAAASDAAAIGADDATATSGVAGIVRTPTPTVAATALPSLTVPDEEVALRAADGQVKAVYFGYTSCPDVCPTTMADLAVALRKLPDGMAERVETLFVTIDPGRDLEIASDYARSFVPDAEAAGTVDDALLAEAAEPFGVVYSVTTDATGEIVVEHSPFLYLVNDAGELLVTWQFGESSDNIAADIETFLDRGGAPV